MCVIIPSSHLLSITFIVTVRYYTPKVTYFISQDLINIVSYEYLILESLYSLRAKIQGIYIITLSITLLIIISFRYWSSMNYIQLLNHRPLIDIWKFMIIIPIIWNLWYICTWLVLINIVLNYILNRDLSPRRELWIILR